MHGLQRRGPLLRLCSVGLLVTTVSPTKTDEPIDMPLAWRGLKGQRNHVLGGGPDSPWEGTIFGAFQPVEKHWNSEVCKQQLYVGP